MAKMISKTIANKRKDWIRVFSDLQFVTYSVSYTGRKF